MKSLEKGELFVLKENNTLCACVVLNSDYNMGYVDVPWNIKCEADEVLIPHALAVSPDCQGLTTLALAYVMEEGLPKQFSKVPIDSLEAAAKRLHDMGYEKVGLWGISKGAELALTVGSLAERKVFQRR